MGRDKLVDSLYAGLLMFPEVLFSVLMMFSSGSMVVILYTSYRFNIFITLMLPPESPQRPQSPRESYSFCLSF